MGGVADHCEKATLEQPVGFDGVRDQFRIESELGEFSAFKLCAPSKKSADQKPAAAAPPIHGGYPEQGTVSAVGSDLVRPVPEWFSAAGAEGLSVHPN